MREVRHEKRIAVIEILHRTEKFIFVNKPSGLLVHRSSFGGPQSQDETFLLQQLRDQVGCWVSPVHRLDRGASGVVGFGVSSEAVRELQEKMAEGSTQKVYLALVRGRAPEGGVIDKTLTNDAGVVQTAETHFTTLAAHDHCSLVQVKIKTGRRHQIRRHLSSIQHQILGDVQHGKGRLNRFYREKYQLNRLFLHAWRLEFADLVVRAPLPEPLLGVLDQLIGEGFFLKENLSQVLDEQRNT